jgi:hypothetical protein
MVLIHKVSVKFSFLFLSFLILMNVLVWTEGAKASESFSAQVFQEGCSLKVKSDRKWMDSSVTLKKDTSILARFSKESPEVLVFRARGYDDSLFAGKKDCLLSPDLLRKNVIDSSENIFRASIGLWSWQEKLSTKYGSENEIPLRANNFGACPGLQWVRLSEKTETGVSLCFLYAKAQISNASQVGVETDLDGDGLDEPESQWIASYKAKNIDVFGALVSPSFYYRPFSESVAFGVQLPIMFRYVVYAEPAQAEAFTFAPRFWILLGVFLESRFELGSLYISNKVGFFNKPNSLAWALEGGYEF